MRVGDIILVKFPFTDLSSYKLRPALVLYRNAKNNDSIVAFISRKSQFKAQKITESEMATGAFPVTSYLILNKVATLNDTLVNRLVGSLRPKVISSILKKFKAQF